MGTEKRARQKANRQARLQAAVVAQQRAKKKRQYLRIGIIAVVVVAVLAGFALWPRGSDDAASSSFAYGTGPCPPDPVTTPTKTFSAAPMRCIDPAKSYVAIFDTTAGTIRAQLDTSTTPGTTNNFVTLARFLYYDATQFFRTNTGIGIIQGGGTSNVDSPGYTIPDEGGKFTYTPGDLVMARGSQPNSAGAQFFFAVNENTASLDAQGTYVTFGKVTEGQDVLDKVLATNKATNPAQPDEGKPDPPVTVTSIRIEQS
jgi:cyclophilin family peptidyl-prolyl cis-trans isomerase